MDDLVAALTLATNSLPRRPRAFCSYLIVFTLIFYRSCNRRFLEFQSGFDCCGEELGSRNRCLWIIISGLVSGNNVSLGTDIRELQRFGVLQSSRTFSSASCMLTSQNRPKMPTDVHPESQGDHQIHNGNTKSSHRKAYRKSLTLEKMNPNVKVMEYAVRGPLVIRAGEIETELKNGVTKPFKEVIRANIGDCHAMGQVPLTYIRQVLALCFYPELLKDSSYPSDVKDHAKRILASCRGGSVGSYTDSTGLDVVRHDVANFIQRRDGGIPSDPENIVLTAGASEGIKSLLKLMNVEHDGKRPGVMVPIPQYPLYSATIAEYGMEQVGYFLDEDHNWALDINELKRSVQEARNNCHPSVICIINPGNPTGQVLTEENIRGVIEFAYEEGLFIMADEVYQDNVYAPGSKFHSFKKVLTEMGAPYNQVELASFYSTSKGFMGECGIRGAYMELVNLDGQVMTMLKKMLSAKLCPTTAGQACIDCVINPPKPGDPSYDLFMKEKSGVLQSLAERAKIVTETFNSIPGIHCNVVQGAMYAFPRLDFPQGLIDKAKSLGQEPDFYYALHLLENTGICIVPGSGFGQRPGTYHFRTTILPPPELMITMMESFKQFHTKFISSFK